MNSVYSCSVELNSTTKHCKNSLVQRLCQIFIVFADNADALMPSKFWFHVTLYAASFQPSLLLISPTNSKTEHFFKANYLTKDFKISCE